MEEAQEVLKISTAWASSFQAAAKKMISINMPASSKNFSSLIETVFPEKPKETERQRKNREQILSTVRALYDNERNAGGFGYTGWSAYNAIVEYLDHYRDADGDERALASMSTTSIVTQKKNVAQAFILALT